MIWRAPGKKHGHLVATVDLDKLRARIGYALKVWSFPAVCAGLLILGFTPPNRPSQKERWARENATKGWVLVRSTDVGDKAQAFATLRDCQLSLMALRGDSAEYVEAVALAEVFSSAHATTVPRCDPYDFKADFPQ